MLLELNSFRNISLKESHRNCHPLSLHTARPSVHAVKMPLMRQWHQSSYGPSHCLAPLGPQEINLLSPQPLRDIKSSVLCPRGGVITPLLFSLFLVASTDVLCCVGIAWTPDWCLHLLLPFSRGRWQLWPQNPWGAQTKQHRHSSQVWPWVGSLGDKFHFLGSQD